MNFVIQAIGWLGAKILSDGLLKWIAMKAILLVLFVVILPIVINNLMYDVIEIMFNFVLGKIGSLELGETVQNVTGVAGWLIVNCKISESLSVILGAVAMRMSLNMIPFVRV